MVDSQCILVLPSRIRIYLVLLFFVYLIVPLLHNFVSAVAHTSLYFS